MWDIMSMPVVSRRGSATTAGPCPSLTAVVLSGIEVLQDHRRAFLFHADRVLCQVNRAISTDCGIFVCYSFTGLVQRARWREVCKEDKVNPIHVAAGASSCACFG